MHQVCRQLRLFIALAFLPGLLACSSGDGSTAGQVVTNYYIDVTAGSDTNDGRTASTAWRSLGKIGTATLQSPAVVYLKRGEVWHESLVIPRSNITIDAYGSGALPLLSGAEPVSGWTNESGGIYSADIQLDTSEGLGHVNENGQVMAFVPWDTDVTTTFSASPMGSFSYDYSRARVYIKPLSFSSAAYTVSRRLIGVQATGLNDISLRNLAIEDYSLHGVQFNDCTRCGAKNLEISRIGGAVVGTNPTAPPAYLYAGNGIEFANSSRSGWVDTVTLSGIFDSCLSAQTFASNQIASNFEFRDSTLEQCGFSGVELSVLANGGATSSRLSNVTLRGLTITASGKGWSGRRYGSEGHGIRIKADAGAGSIDGVTIDTTTVTTSAGNGIAIAGESNRVVLRRLAIQRNDQAGIELSDPDAVSPFLDLASSLVYRNQGDGVRYNAPTASGLALYHNTFVDNAGINLAILNQAGEATILNNLFYSTAPMTHVFVENTLAGGRLDHNCYNDTVNMFGYNNQAYSSVATFNTDTGFEGQGIGDQDQALRNPALDDFRLGSTSACRGRGLSGLTVTRDYLGNPYGEPPSSGAYAYVP